MVAMMLLGLLVAGGVLPVAGRSIYERVVRRHAADWERTVERNEGGVRTCAESYTVGDGATALLLVHGFGASPAVFARMAPALATRGYTCRVMRLPGFGEEASRMVGVTKEQWMAELESEIGLLRKEHREVWLVGHSLGAALSLLAAATNDVAGVVAMAPLVEVSSRRSPLLAPRSWFRVASVFMKPGDLVETAFDADLHDPTITGLEARERFAPFSVYAELFRVTEAVVAGAPSMHKPLLMGVAPGDKVVDSSAAESYYSCAGAPRKLLVRQLEAGHVLPLDLGWDDMVTQMDGFIRENSEDRPTP